MYLLRAYSIFSKASINWRALSRRAKVNEDYTITIVATDMTKEGLKVILVHTLKGN